jgi:hypothetical protein
VSVKAMHKVDLEILTQHSNTRAEINKENLSQIASF